VTSWLDQVSDFRGERTDNNAAIALVVFLFVDPDSSLRPLRSLNLIEGREEKK
jgi:hypothetical protein